MSATAELLKGFKDQESERGEVVHPLVRDPILRNLVVIWPMLPIEFTPPSGVAPEDDRARWFWLWEGVKYDAEQLSEALRLDKIKLGKIVERAKMFRLIYPDGTTNRLATQYVRGDIAKSLQRKSGPKSSKGGDASP
jgi:hypothetical protein